MRTRYLLNICFLALLIGAGIAQPVQAQTLSLNDEKTKTEDGQEVDSWAADLDQEEEYVRRTFDRFMRDTYGIKVEKRAKNILVAEKAKIVEITPLRGDLRAIVTSRNAGTKIAVTFSPGYDIHLNKKDYPAELAKVGNLVRRYIKYHYNTFYKEQITANEKKIKDMQDDIDRNNSRIAKMKSEISSNENKINAGDKQTPKLGDRNRKMNESIAEMENDNSKMQEQIDMLQGTIAQANSSLRKVDDFQ